MNTHDLIFNLIKNLGYFFLLMVTFIVLTFIFSQISLSFIIAYVILTIVSALGFGWIGYKNTKNANNSKIKNSFILHIIISILFGVLTLIFDEQPLWRIILSIVYVLVGLEIGSLTYYLKKQEKAEYLNYMELYYLL